MPSLLHKPQAKTGEPGPTNIARDGYETYQTFTGSITLPASTAEPITLIRFADTPDLITIDSRTIGIDYFFHNPGQPLGPAYRPQFARPFQPSLRAQIISLRSSAAGVPAVISVVGRWTNRTPHRPPDV